MKSITFSHKLPVSIIKQDRGYVAYTPALDLSTTGSTEKKVKEHFATAVELFFEELEEAGTTEDVLCELGWKKVRTQWLPPKIVSRTSFPVKIAVSA